MANQEVQEAMLSGALLARQGVDRLSFSTSFNFW